MIPHAVTKLIATMQVKKVDKRVMDTSLTHVLLRGWRFRGLTDAGNLLWCYRIGNQRTRPGL